MIVTLDSKRRLTVPAALASTSPGWLTVLKECPVSMNDCRLLAHFLDSDASDVRGAFQQAAARAPEKR